MQHALCLACSSACQPATTASDNNAGRRKVARLFFKPASLRGQVSARVVGDTNSCRHETQNSGLFATMIGATRRTLTGRAKRRRRRSSSSSSSRLLHGPVSICRPSCASVSREGDYSRVCTALQKRLALLARRRAGCCAIRGELRGLGVARSRPGACRVTYMQAIE